MKGRWKDTTDRKPAEVFPPGEFMADECEARGIPCNAMALILRISDAEYGALMTGGIPMTKLTCAKVGLLFGTGTTMWLRLEATWQQWRPKE